MRAIPNALLLGALLLAGCPSRSSECRAGNAALAALLRGEVPARSLPLSAWARSQAWARVPCRCVGYDASDRSFSFECEDHGFIALGVPWRLDRAPPAGSAEVTSLRHWPTRPADEKAVPDGDYTVR